MYWLLTSCLRTVKINKFLQNESKLLISLPRFTLNSNFSSKGSKKVQGLEPLFYAIFLQSVTSFKDDLLKKAIVVLISNNKKNIWFCHSLNIRCVRTFFQNNDVKSFRIIVGKNQCPRVKNKTLLKCFVCHK